MRRRSLALSRPPLLVKLPEKLGADDFEDALASAGVRCDHRGAITVDLTEVAFATVEVLVTLVTLCNLVARVGGLVTLRWKPSQSSFKYAERIGVFSRLDERVDVLPQRPMKGASAFETFQDYNRSLLELCSVDPKNRSGTDSTLERLDERLCKNLGSAAKAEDAIGRIWTCASETLDNIFQHSETPIAGIIAAQPYAGTRSRLQLVIADAGLGLTTTIRAGNPKAVGLSDVDLIVAAFREGLSRRLEGGHGCGLTRCAEVAARYGGNLRVRTGHTWAKLVTKSRKTGWSVAISEDHAAPIHGTIIAFDFYLDRLQ
jgi:hypothetical protein